MRRLVVTDHGMIWLTPWLPLSQLVRGQLGSQQAPAFSGT